MDLESTRGSPGQRIELVPNNDDDGVFFCVLIGNETQSPWRFSPRCDSPSAPTFTITMVRYDTDGVILQPTTREDCGHGRYH